MYFNGIDMILQCIINIFSLYLNVFMVYFNIYQMYFKYIYSMFQCIWMNLLTLLLAFHHHILVTMILPYTPTYIHAFHYPQWLPFSTHSTITLFHSHWSILIFIQSIEVLHINSCSSCIYNTLHFTLYVITSHA
jgi:hypothetical protein